jgi:hypothetical protein
MYNGAANLYRIPSSNATALFIGDPVVPVTASADANGVPTITHAAAGGGSFVLGAVVGIISAGDPVIAQTRDNTVYRPASTERYVLVADDPDLMFEMQEDAVGGALAVTAGSRNVDLVSGAGSTVTGYSGWQLDSSTLAVTNTLQMRLYRPVERSDNEPGVANAKWWCSINLHNVRSTLGI